MASLKLISASSNFFRPAFIHLNLQKPLSWRFYSNSNDDFIVFRKDKFWSYSFAGVIDDASQSITRVIRGSDLKPTLARNRMIQNSLGLHFPKFTPLEFITSYIEAKFLPSNKLTLVLG